MKQILVFILFAAMLCWMLFAPIYKHVIIMRQAFLQKEVDYLLEIGANASHGYVDASMIAASKLRLANNGFSSAELIYTVSATNGANGTESNQPILRGAGIRLEISYPYQNLFDIDQLIGIVPPVDGLRMTAAGMKMSEYVPN